jgi:hypothetical protein
MRAALQVDALAGGVVGNHHAHDRVAVEGSDRGTAALTRDAAMDHHDRVGVAEPGGNLLREIFQRVLGLGENDDLAP